MTATINADYVASSTRFSQLWPAAVAHMKKNLPQIVVFAVIGAVGSYLVNIYWIAKRYEGTNVPSGAPVTTQAAFKTGMLFWILMSSVVFGLIGHRRAVGGTQFWGDVREFPKSVAGIFRRDGSGLVHLLWGFAVSIVLTGVLAPSLRGVLAVGVAMTIPSMLGRVLMSYISRVWSGVLRKLNPDKEHPPVPIVAPAVAGFGAAAAMAVGFLADDTTTQIVLAVAAAGIALFISQQKKSPTDGTSAPTAVLLVAFAGMVALAIAAGSPSKAHADDGGYAECGSSWSEWWDCDGSDRVRSDSTWGGLAGGLGSVIGSGAVPGMLSGASQAAGGGGMPGGGGSGGSTPSPGGGSESGRDPEPDDGDVRTHLDGGPPEWWDDGDMRTHTDGGPGWWTEGTDELDPVSESDPPTWWDDGGDVQEGADEEPLAVDDAGSADWWPSEPEPAPEPVEVSEPEPPQLVSAWDPDAETFRRVTPAERERLEARDRDVQRERRHERDAAELAEIREDRARVDRLAEQLRRRDELEAQLLRDEAEAARLNDPDYIDDAVTREAFDGMLRDLEGLPDEFRGLAEAINEQMNDPENWRILEETLRDTSYDAAGLVSPVPFGNGAENIAETGRQAGELGRAIGNAIKEDPVGFVYGLTPFQDLEDAMDPDKTLGERLGHLGMGLADLFGGAGAATTAADAVTDASRALDAADAARDAARAAEAADAARDAARAAEAADALRDANRTTDLVGDVSDANRAAGRAGDLADAHRATDAADDLVDATRGAGLPDDVARAADDLTDANRGAGLADELTGATDDLTDANRASATQDAVQDRLNANRNEVDGILTSDEELARQLDWERNRRTGAEKVDDFASTVDDTPRPLTPDEAQRRTDAALELQGNKQALQDMKGQPDAVKEAFNAEMRSIYDATDREVLDWARNHVDELDSGQLRGVKFEGDLVDSGKLPKDPPVGIRIFRDGATPPNEIHLFEPTNPKGGISVGADRDFAVYVQPGGKSAVPGIDPIPIDHRQSGRAYNDAFFDHAGGERTMERLGMDRATPASVAEDAKRAGVEPAELARQRNADALAERLDQAVTDDLHAEAYTNVDRVIGRPFAPLDDAQQVGMTSTYKGDHWSERAAHSVGPQAESEIAEGFRQITKQHGNQIAPRMEQLQHQVDYLRQQGVLPDDAVNIRQNPTLERGVEIMKRVGKDDLSPVAAERMLRDELGVTSRDINRMAGEQLESMNDLIPGEVKSLQDRMNSIADDLEAATGTNPSVDDVWAELRRRDSR